MPEDFACQDATALTAPPSNEPQTEAPEASPDADPGTPAVAEGVPESPRAYALGLEEILNPEQGAPGLELDQALEEEFRKTAHSLGLKQADAARLAGMYARHQADRAAGAHAAQNNALREAEEAWLKELRADKGFSARLTQARAAINTYGSPELTHVLEATRLGSHPAVVRFMARVGEALAEPAFARGENGYAEKSPAEVLYPNQSKH